MRRQNPYLQGKSNHPTGAIDKDDEPNPDPALPVLVLQIFILFYYLKKKSHYIILTDLELFVETELALNSKKVT